MRIINNEKGGALVYVLMVAVVIGVFTPVILHAVSQNEADERRMETEIKVMHITASAMEMFIELTANLTQQMDFLEDNYNQEITFNLPEGMDIVYRHFVVPASTEDSDVFLVTPVPFANIVDNTFKAVITAKIGTHVQTLTRIFDATVTPTERTAAPLIYQMKATAAATVVTGRAESLSAITVIRGTDTVIGTGIADGSVVGSEQTYSIGVDQLIAGETISVTAKASSKLISYAATRIVDPADTPTNDGLVAKVTVDEEGNETITYQEFQNVDTSSGELVVYNNEEGTATYSDSTDVDLQGDTGVKIDSGVVIQTTSSGSGTLNFESSGGDVTMSGTSIVNNGNASFSEVRIVAAGDVYMENATIFAKRDVIIQAGGNIYANGATITSDNANGAISFTLLPYVSGNRIQVNSMTLNKDASASPSGAAVCGTLSAGTINTLTTFGACE